MAEFAYTYDTLKSALQSSSHDYDEDLTSEIERLISLGERRVTGDVDFDAAHEFATGTLTANDENLAYPSGAVAIRVLRLASVASTNYQPIEKRTLSYVRDAFPENTTATKPKVYAPKDETGIILGPKPDAAYPYEMEYDVRLTGLSTTTATTWISVNQGPLLFFACRLEVAIWGESADDEKRYLANYQDQLRKVGAEIGRVRSSALNALRND